MKDASEDTSVESAAESFAKLGQSLVGPMFWPKDQSDPAPSPGDAAVSFFDDFENSLLEQDLEDISLHSRRIRTTNPTATTTTHRPVTPLAGRLWAPLISETFGQWIGDVQDKYPTKYDHVRPQFVVPIGVKPEDSLTRDRYLEAITEESDEDDDVRTVPHEVRAVEHEVRTVEDGEANKGKNVNYGTGRVRGSKGQPRRGDDRNLYFGGPTLYRLNAQHPRGAGRGRVGGAFRRGRGGRGRPFRGANLGRTPHQQQRQGEKKFEDKNKGDDDKSGGGLKIKAPLPIPKSSVERRPPHLPPSQARNPFLNEGSKRQQNNAGDRKTPHAPENVSKGVRADSNPYPNLKKNAEEDFSVPRRRAGGLSEGHNDGGRQVRFDDFHQFNAEVRPKPRPRFDDYDFDDYERKRQPQGRHNSNDDFGDYGFDDFGFEPPGRGRRRPPGNDFEDFGDFGPPHRGRGGRGRGGPGPAGRGPPDEGYYDNTGPGPFRGGPRGRGEFHGPPRGHFDGPRGRGGPSGPAFRGPPPPHLRGGGRGGFQGDSDFRGGHRGRPFLRHGGGPHGRQPPEYDDYEEENGRNPNGPYGRTPHEGPLPQYDYEYQDQEGRSPGGPFSGPPLGDYEDGDYQEDPLNQAPLLFDGPGGHGGRSEHLFEPGFPALGRDEGDYEESSPYHRNEEGPYGNNGFRHNNRDNDEYGVDPRYHIRGPQDFLSGTFEVYRQNFARDNKKPEYHGGGGESYFTGPGQSDHNSYDARGVIGGAGYDVIGPAGRRPIGGNRRPPGDRFPPSGPLAGHRTQRHLNQKNEEPGYVSGFIPVQGPHGNPQHLRAGEENNQGPRGGGDYHQESNLNEAKKPRKPGDIFHSKGGYGSGRGGHGSNSVQRVRTVLASKASDLTPILAATPTPIPTGVNKNAATTTTTVATLAAPIATMGLAGVTIAMGLAGSGDQHQDQFVTGRETLAEKILTETYWESWVLKDYPEDYCALLSSVPATPIGSIEGVTHVDIAFGDYSGGFGGVEVDESVLIDGIQTIHARGGKVKLAYGGALFSMSQHISTIDDAHRFAESVLELKNVYGLDGIDLDVEDGSEEPALQLEVIKSVRELCGDDFLISYTFPALASQFYPYNEVIAGGHEYLDALNIMAYDYYWEDYVFDMDVYLLDTVGVPRSKMVWGLMPGHHDAGNEYTSLDDIRNATEYAKYFGLGGLMTWDINRDCYACKGNPSGTDNLYQTGLPDGTYVDEISRSLNS